MKIEQIETFFIDRYLVVRITADDGTQGIGESCYWSYPKAAEATIQAWESELQGMDPGDTEHIFNYLYRYNGAVRGNGVGGALSAVDIALWDIKGKRLQAPIWDLLGGKVRQKVRAIALGVGGETPEECAIKAKKVKDEGYTALKFTAMSSKWPEQRYGDMINLGTDMVEAVREAVGWDFDIGIEIHRNMKPAEAVVFADSIAKFLPYFIEDPIVPDSVVAMGEVGDKFRVPLAVGERNFGVHEFREFAQLSNCAFFKPDIAVAGGITGCKKIATIAESYHVKIAPHNFQGPIATAACVQLGTSSLSWDVQEAVNETVSPRVDMVDEVIPVVDGYFIPSERPGLGMEFNEDSAVKFPFKPAQIPPPIAEDGSVALK
jgi:galactonate dehydratase